VLIDRVKSDIRTRAVKDLEPTDVVVGNATEIEEPSAPMSVTAPVFVFTW
jgi:hypothetical protein